MMKSIALLATIVVSSSAFTQVSRPSFGLTTLKAEAAWSPKDGGKWEDTDFEKDLQKLEVESEKRLEEKIRELMFNIEKTGQGSN